MVTGTETTLEPSLSRFYTRSVKNRDSEGDRIVSVPATTLVGDLALFGPNYPNTTVDFDHNWTQRIQLCTGYRNYSRGFVCQTFGQNGPKGPF